MRSRVTGPLLAVALGAHGGCARDCDEICLAARYDVAHAQSPVESTRAQKAVLRDLPRLAYRDLPRAYVERSGQTQKPFARRLRRRRYYVVAGDARHRFIAGSIRLSDLMAPALDGDHRSPYLLLDRRLPPRLLALRRWLDKRGYDPDGFRVREGFRPPTVNQEGGGAPFSRHIYGEAVDLVRGDLDRDGDADQDDKAILLRAAEATIGNRGGIGRYPGTETVHIDVRGRRARWDSY
ncbi:MAG: D-Ala-D-Ala carboxypeptidase family metallohydrolase [Myxococcota bacterium]